LGAVLTEDGSREKDIRYTIGKASSVFARLNENMERQTRNNPNKINCL